VPAILPKVGKKALTAHEDSYEFCGPTVYLGDHQENLEHENLIRKTIDPAVPKAYVGTFQDVEEDET